MRILYYLELLMKIIYKNFIVGGKWIWLSGTTIIFRFSDKSFYRYLYSQSIGTIFIDELTDRNTPSIKLSLVISSMLVSQSVIKLTLDLLMENVRKKITRFILSVFFQWLNSGSDICCNFFPTLWNTSADLIRHEDR